MSKCELTNMVMIEDKATGKVLVQQNLKRKGLTFPGGHIEDGESFVLSAIREIREETGLEVRNIKACGVVHWMNLDTYDRYIVFLYKASDWTGQLSGGSDEGRVFWIEPERIFDYTTASGFDYMFRMFFDDEYSEVFVPYRDGEWEIAAYY